MATISLCESDTNVNEKIAESARQLIPDLANIAKQDPFPTHMRIWLLYDEENDMDRYSIEPFPSAECNTDMALAPRKQQEASCFLSSALRLYIERYVFKKDPEYMN